MMSDIKVGDIVSVEVSHDNPLNCVGKIHSISSSREAASIQVGTEKFKAAKLCHCWNATPTQKKYFFKEMLGG